MKRATHVHKDILGEVLLRIIYLLGYELFTQGIQKPMQPMYIRWELRKRTKV